MALGGQDGMTLARARNFLQLSGADKEASDIVNVAGVKIDSDREGYTRVVDVTKLREDLILKLERERSDQVVQLRAKQKQIMVDKEGREAELLELQKAEEAHRELLLKDRDERNKIAKDLHSLRRGHLVDMEEETRRELSALQRERELLQAKEKENIDAIDEVRRQIMEQDEVYHRAMDEAGRKIQDGKGGVDKDGRPLADAAKRQRQAIQAEQVALAESYGKRAGALREEQAKLQRELKDVKGRVRKIGKEAAAPAKGAEDALAALMTEAGMEEQAARLRKLKVNFEKEHAEAVSGGYIKEYEGAEAATRKALRNGDRLLEGRTGEYAEATADAFLDDWLKTDAERARDAASTAAAASNSSSSTSSSTTGSTPRKPPAGVPSLPLDGTKNPGGIRVAGKYAGRDRGLHPSVQNAAAPASRGKKKRHSHQHDQSHDGAQRGQHGNGPETDGAEDRYADERGNYKSSPGKRKSASDEYEKGNGGARGDDATHGRHGSGGDVGGGGDGSGGRGGRNAPNGKRSGNHGDKGGAREGSVGTRGTGAHAQRPQSGQREDESHPRRRNAVVLPAVGSPDLRGGTQSAEHLYHSNRDDNTGPFTPSTGRRRARSRETGAGDDAEGSRTGYTASQPGRGGRKRAPGQANDDAARLRATVERLETELNSVKVGMGAGGATFGIDGFGMGRGHGGVPFGAAAPAGSQWMAAPGMQQYIASLDAENARMLVELQGLSATGAGLGGGNLGLLGPMGGAAAGSSTVFPGAGLAIGGVAGGYAPQVLQGTDRGREEGESAGRFRGQASRDGRGKGTRKKSDAPIEDDAAGLGGGLSGEPLSPRNREYRLKMVEMDAEHKEAVKRLEFEMQRLELEQQLEDMRERMAREKKTRQQNVAHEQWVTEQKRNLQAIKIEKTLAKERQLMEVQQTLSGGRPGGGAPYMYGAGGGRSAHGGPDYGGEATAVQGVGGWRPGVGGIMQRPYNQDRGFCVFWDYILGLPKRSGSKVIGKVRLAFGLYVGRRLHGKMLSTQWADIARSSVKHETTGKVESCALLETRNVFAGIPLNVQTKLVVELQFKDSAGVQSKGGKDNLGWGCIHTFKCEKHNPQRLTVRAGLTRLTLFPGNVDLRIANVNDDRSALSRSTPMAAFIRLVHAEDMNAAAAFVVDPDTHQLYGAYGRGHLSQMERQKLMTGTFLRVLLILAKFKRSLSLTSAKAPGASTIGGMKENVRPLKALGRPGSSLLSRTAALASPRADKPAAAKDDAVKRMPNAGDNDAEDGETPEANNSAAEESEALEGGDDLSQGKQDSLGEETSQTADGSVEGAESVVSERRRSSLASLQSQIATQKTMARRASLTKRRESTASRQPFLKGDGFDLYIDLGGGMPYPCTVSKVVVRVIGYAGEQRGSESSAISEGDSLSNTPVFRLRQEHRIDPDERMDMTSTVMIRVDTVDRFSSEHRAVGYALVAVFMDPQGDQPTNSTADGVFLREGNYQVPLYQRPPPDMRRITSKSLDKFARVPCASVMVRVKPAPKSSAGKTLSTADVAKEEWKTFGLMIPMPEFAPGVYDNSALQLTDLEREILELRSQDREQEMVEQAAKLVEPSENPAPEYQSSSDQEAFKEWAEALMAKKPQKMIEYQRSEKYRADRGFSVTVAGLINMKPTGAFKPPKLYKVIYSLFMPGLYYLGNPPLSDQAEFTLSYDLRSPQTAPRFKDPPYAFRSQKINQSQLIIVDVRFLKVDAKEVATVPEEPSVAPASGAWGLLPVFSNGDVATGSFVVPLLSGPVPPAILNTENPLRFMAEKIKIKHPNFRVLEGSSAVVQTCNALLQNVLPPGTQDPNLNYIYVKRVTDAAGTQQEKYAFEYVTDAGVKSVGRLVPKTFKDRHDAFFHLANKRLADATGMTHVLRREAAKAR